MKRLFRFVFVVALIAVIAVAVIPSIEFDKFSTKAVSLFKGYSTKLLEENDERYYYKKLNTSQKLAYVAILNGVKKFPDRITITNLNDTELQEMYTALLNDNPELFYLTHSCSVVTWGKIYMFEPSYSMTEEQYEKAQATIDTVKEKVLSSINYSMSDFERELFVHDYLSSICSYTDSESSDSCYTIYGALVLNEANCEGYSKAMSYLLNDIDIDTRVITGTASNETTPSEGHMWNIVTLNNKDYHLDVTWDDYTVEGTSTTEYKEASHIYMNVPTVYISSTHMPSDSSDCDSCIYEDDNYFKVKGLYFEAYDENTKSKIIKTMAEKLDSDKTGIEIRFSNSSAYNTAVSKLLNANDTYNLIKKANAISSKNDASTQKFYCVKDDQKYIIRIFFD